jgi:hypothetical protein
LNQCFNVLKLIQNSPASVKCRYHELNLKGSGTTTKALSAIDAEQLVINEMSKDPAQHHGVKTIQYKVAYNSGTHLTRYAIPKTSIPPSTYLGPEILS